MMKLAATLLLLVFTVGCDRSSQRALATATADGAATAAPATGPHAVTGGIEFAFEDPAAQSIHLAGSFNNWSTDADPMVKDAKGRWRIVKALPAGTHQYKFVVNGGQAWKPDPTNPNASDDGFGGKNSMLEVATGGQPVPAPPATAATPAPSTPAATKPSASPQQTDAGWRFMFDMPSAQSVHLAGSFNDWSTSADPLAKDAAGRWTLVRALPSGTHQYKFVINGQQWKEDPGNTNTGDDGYGGKNSIVVVP